MLTSLALQLKSPTEATLPSSLGRAGQALLLRLIEVRDMALATELHESSGSKPYAVSNLLMGTRRNGSLHIKKAQEGWLRFSSLTAKVSEHLLALADAPPQTVELDGQTFNVTGATVKPEEHPWAGSISYQDLAAPYLLGTEARPSPKICLDFVSPTTFSSNGRSVPLPQPELVFGSLLNRWQTFAPIGLNPEVRRFAEEAMVVSRYKLRTRGMPYKGRGLQIGFTGQVTFETLNRDRYWLSVLHLLAAFAFFSGVGYQTGTGLGQVRPI